MRIMPLLMFTAVSLFAAAQISPASGDRQAEQAVRQASGQEVQAFLHKDPKTMAQLWSDDLVVTNPLNKFVTKQQVLGMVQSGFLNHLIRPWHRIRPRLWRHRDPSGQGNGSLGREDAECRED